MRIVQWHSGSLFPLTIIFFIILTFFAIPLFATDSLLLSVILNKEQKGIFIGEMTADGKILLLESDLRQMGIRNIAAAYEEINGEMYIYIDSINGAKIDFDEKNLALEIMVPPDILNRNMIDLYPKRRKDVYYPRDSSAFLNYRFEYLDGNVLKRTMTLSNELGIRSGDLLFLTDSIYTDTPSDNSFVRLTTSLIHDDRKNMQRTVAGDFFAASGELESVVNMGGVSFSKLYSIDPYSIQYPLLDISGVTALPSEISLYRDGISMFSRQISPGEFDIQNISYYDGSSDIELVITDIFGREQRIASPFYFTSRLLKEGLHEYSYNFGLLREQFGTESNDYEDITLMAFHRYGFHDMFTGGSEQKLQMSSLMRVQKPPRGFGTRVCSSSGWPEAGATVTVTVSGELQDINTGTGDSAALWLRAGNRETTQQSVPLISLRKLNLLDVSMPGIQHTILVLSVPVSW